MYRNLILILLLFSIAFTTSADERIVDFSDDSLPVLNNNLERMRDDIDRTPRIYTGTASPTTAPFHTGDMFLDTSNEKVYIATGVSSSSDWIVMN